MYIYFFVFLMNGKIEWCTKNSGVIETIFQLSGQTQLYVDGKILTIYSRGESVKFIKKH